MAPNNKEAGATSATRHAKLFWHGRSQAVRLPKEFRFEGDEVAIRREGETVILEPVEKRGWPEGYWENIDRLRGDLDFPEAEPLGGALLDVDLDFDSAAIRYSAVRPPRGRASRKAPPGAAPQPDR